MTNISTGRTTANILSNRRVIDMAKEIALIDPSVAPFLTIVKRMKGGAGVRVAISPKIEWLEDDYVGVSSTVATQAAGSASATSLVVASGTGGLFRAGDIILDTATGENMLVTSISTDTLTVARAYGSVAAAQASVGDTIIIIGNANKENDGKRSVLSTQEAAKFNYTQIFRTPCEMSNTLVNSELYGGKDRAYQRRKSLAEHKLDIARSMYFGQKKEDTSAGVRRTMGGLVEFIKTGSNTQAFSSGSGTSDVNFTWKKFNEKVAKNAFTHGSDEKLMVVGGVTAAAIDAWDIDKSYSKMDEASTFGVHVKRLVTTYGVLNVVWDRLLDNCGKSDYGMILDMDKIRYAYLQNRDTKLRTNIQPPDQDGVIDEYLTECSLEVKNPDTHFLFTGAYVG